jgi:hypothetical protein
MAVATEDRTPVEHDLHTEDLPALPQRHTMIPATRWIEAPAEVRELGRDLGVPLVSYIRRIGPYLVWRAGRAAGERARYCAVDADDLDERWLFELDADGNGSGIGPDGVEHHRFRDWKLSLKG